MQIKDMFFRKNMKKILSTAKFYVNIVSSVKYTRLTIFAGEP